MSSETPKLLNSGIVNVQFGKNVKVVQPANIYGCTIGDDCFIGPFVEIQRSVVIGQRTRVQSHTFVCELVTIGDDCFVGHGVMFVNDVAANGRPSFGREDLWKPTRVGNRVFIGSNVTMLPVNVCDDVLIGAGSVVTKDITKSGVYAGNPARFLRPLEEKK